MSTELQKRLARKLIENIDCPANKRKSATRMLKEAGYSKFVSEKCQKQVMNFPGLKEELASTLKRLEELRDKALDALDVKNFKKEDLRDLNNLLRNLNHDIQLLSGGETDRTEVFVLPTSLMKKNGIKTNSPS